jgi:hypothetical protein
MNRAWDSIRRDRVAFPVCSRIPTGSFGVHGFLTATIGAVCRLPGRGCHGDLPLAAGQVQCRLSSQFQWC